MASHEERGRALLREAEEKLRAPTGFFAFLSGGGSIKTEEAAELFTKAANYFKLAKQFDQSGDAYMRAADLYLKSSVKHEAAACFINASGVLKKTNVQGAIDCMRKAIDYYTTEGRFSIAAKYQKEIAELYEAFDPERAIESYQLAADYFEGEGASSSAGKCLLKVAEYAATVKAYDKAIAIFDQVADASLQNNLLRYSAKDYFFSAVICRLCIPDAVAAKLALESYQEKDHTFSTTREYRFLSLVVTAFEENDIEAFTLAVRDYDRVLKLNKWQTTILFRIKEMIQDDDDDEALT